MRWLSLSLLSMVLSVAHAADTVTIKNAWVRAPAPGRPMTAAYLTIESSQPLTLFKVTSPVAGTVEMHTMNMKGDVMEMRQVEGIDVKPGAPANLAPGGLHLMLFDLKKPLKAGDTVALTLSFKDGKRPAVSKGIKVPVKTSAE